MNRCTITRVKPSRRSLKALYTQCNVELDDILTQFIAAIDGVIGVAIGGMDGLLVEQLPADNRALISGQSAMIWNPPSAWAVAVRDAPAIAADTWHFPAPSGPKGRFIPHVSTFWAIWQFAKNKSAAKDLIEFLMQPEHVATRSTAVMGYDLPPYQKMADADVWDKIGPPVGTVYNYPVRKQHNAIEHVAHMPAPPEIAVQIATRGTGSTMFAKLKSGDSIDQVIGWASRELDGFVR